MYLYELRYSNAYYGGSGSWQLELGQGGLKKWNFLTPAGSAGGEGDSGQRELELLRLAALACCGCRDYLDRLPCQLAGLARDKARALQLGITWVEHGTERGAIIGFPPRHSGLKVTPQGKGAPLGGKGERLLSPGTGASYKQVSRWSPPAKCTVFAYGDSLRAHAGGDDFDFNDPCYQLRRIVSLFQAGVPLTDPPAFLANLHSRGVGYSRYMPARILEDMQRLIQKYLKVDTTRWLVKGLDLAREWARLSPGQQGLLLPLIDASRHLHDALPSYGNPLHFPGLMLLYRPDRYCPTQHFSTWVKLLDGIFPAMQFVLVVPDPMKKLLPGALLHKVLPPFPGKAAPAQAATPRPAGATSLAPGTILLVDVDSRLPNLALMKLAGYYRQRGYRVKLAKKEAYDTGAEAIFASSIFHLPPSRKRLKRMQDYYGDSLQCGGSGFDLKKRLPREIEDAEPDYGIYPELQDRAMGFLTRGCPFHCPFCIVPIKEGKPRQVADLDDLARGRDKLILLDDNILAHPRSHGLLEELAAKKLKVNFNQTLDLNLVDEDKARLIRAIPSYNVKFSRTAYYFSLNDARDLPRVRKKYELFDFQHHENVEFVCMYGYNTTLAQDLERFRFLRTLPGAYVFVQEYQPIPGGPEPQLEHFFADQPTSDLYIDELANICFKQNMKNMEKYYRWLSKMYAKKFGTLHMGLVDTIFRYNHRYKRGRYIASLAGTRQ